MCVFLYIFSFIYSFVLRAAQNILNMIFIGDVLVCALWAVQNFPYMVAIGDVSVYVAQNIHPGGCIAFRDDFVFALGAAQYILSTRIS